MEKCRDEEMQIRDMQICIGVVQNCRGAGARGVDVGVVGVGVDVGVGAEVRSEM